MLGTSQAGVCECVGELRCSCVRKFMRWCVCEGGWGMMVVVGIVGGGGGSGVLFDGQKVYYGIRTLQRRHTVRFLVTTEY